MLKIQQTENGDMVNINLIFEEVICLLKCPVDLKNFSVNILDEVKISQLPYDSKIETLKQLDNQPVLVYSFKDNGTIKKGKCVLKSNEQLKIIELNSRLVTIITKLLRKGS